MHTKDDKIVDYFAKRIPASRFMVNTPSALGGIGASSGLMPTLGCGAVGGSATSENVGPMNLLYPAAMWRMDCVKSRKSAPVYRIAPVVSVKRQAPQKP